MTLLRIGVIGTGIMGADHVETVSTAISGAEVRAIADIDPERAEMIASRVPGAKALPSAESLIESAEVDGVIIASSDATHARYVIACLAARKPVLCEKPLAPTVAECEEILRMEQAAGVRMVQVGFMRRFDPGYAELRRRIASGEVGTPVLAHCVHRNVDVPASWTSETTVFSSASHEIDVMPWVFGREVIRVNWLSPTPAAPGLLRDPQVVILELEGGALVFDELFVKSGYGYEIRCEVVGQAGTLELAPTARVVARSGLKVSQDFPPDWRGRFAEAYRRELQTWVNAISRWRSGDVESAVGPVDGPDAWDGYRAAVVAQAVLASMSRGGPVEVESMALPQLYGRCRGVGPKTGGAE
ncbi:MAG: Gfo/Idh/MocA family oxidoreductase [Verrucomicrobia bacterium]|nr:Gfo/Idh/MocA family oxidoreductase [Verrucomicrobiota bacterium]